MTQWTREDLYGKNSVLDGQCSDCKYVQPYDSSEHIRMYFCYKMKQGTPPKHTCPDYQRTKTR